MKAAAVKVSTYSLQCPSYDEKDLLATFKRLFDRGYDCDAVFLFEPDGILIKIERADEVPPGATSFGEMKDDSSHQYSSHPSVLKYKFVMFPTSQLIPALSNDLERLGYTRELHHHLLQAARDLPKDKDPSVDYLKITNAVIPPGLLLRLGIPSLTDLQFS